LTAQPGPKRIKETSPPLFLSSARQGAEAPPGGAEEEDRAATRGLASNAAFALKPDDHPGRVLACLSSHADLTVP